MRKTWRDYQGDEGRRLIAEAKRGIEPPRRKKRKPTRDANGRDIRDRRLIATVDGREWKAPFRIADWARPLFDEITAAHEGLVRSIAKPFARAWKGCATDIYAAGRIGLLYAVANFDTDRGAQFSTFARWHILHHVQREVQFHGRTVRLSVRMQEAMRKAVQSGAITAEEAVAATGKKAIADYWRGMQVRSLDAPLGHEADSVTMHDRLASAGRSPEEAAISAEHSEIVREALGTLSPSEAEVVGLRWLTRAPKARNPHEEHGGDEMRTLSEVGRMRGRSRERTRQIETGAFEKLARELKKRLKDAA